MKNEILLFITNIANRAFVDNISGYGLIRFFEMYLQIFRIITSRAIRNIVFVQIHASVKMKRVVFHFFDFFFKRLVFIHHIGRINLVLCYLQDQIGILLDKFYIIKRFANFKHAFGHG